MSQVDTELEKGLLAILCTFHKYAQGKMGDLHQAAFQSLLRSELCHLLTDTEQQETVRMVFINYDADRNQNISFDEYVNLIAYILRKLCVKHGN
ncbi:protein S100-A16-like [Alligator sinensis]|uniref:Protein S100-A16-like n=1 Tax=Alligator sinensis TaxID=38654 RepID=A0A1U8DZX8_ALLSI|nr:protein S100-A16-like [Alligator sinensis]XP_014382795.1 protein S100-A16-like [Alligator sinensis]